VPRGRSPAELFRYPRKKDWIAYPLWLFGGLLGLHRFYLRRTGTAVLMFLTVGVGGLWWLVDLFRIGGLLREHNQEQARRERAGEPPVALAFLDAVPGRLDSIPEWAGRRTGASSVVGDVLVLLVAGLSLGAVAGATGSYRSIAALCLLAGVLVAGGRVERLEELPIVADVLAWSWRLRLFYHRVGPGSALSRLLRPVSAFLVDPFRSRRRAEAELYLQLGGLAAILFGGVDLVTGVAAPLVAGAGVGGAIGAWAESGILTLVNVYAFAVPIGATLARPVLARRPRGELWGLASWAGSMVLIGLFAVA